MNSADSGVLAANTETRNDSASMAVGGQNCHTLQEALVFFHFAFDDSLAAREVAACPPSPRCNVLVPSKWLPQHWSSQQCPRDKSEDASVG